MSEYKCANGQEFAINHLDGDMIVSANAGTGKTYTMIKRMMTIILSGKAHVNELLAVTFTNKAAEEMKERLKKAISEEIAGGRQDLVEELYAISTADICTIDSFCYNLAKSYFYVCGVEPDFEISDANHTEMLRNKVINDLFEEKYNTKDEQFIKLLEVFSKKRKDKVLKEIVLKIYKNLSVEMDRHDILYKCVENYNEQGFNNVLQDMNNEANRFINITSGKMAQLLQEAKLLNLPKYVKVIENYIDYLNNLLKLNSVYEKKLLQTPKNTSKPSKTNNEPDVVTELGSKYTSCKARLKKRLDNFLEIFSNRDTDFNNFIACKEISGYLANLVEDFSNRYIEKEHELSTLDFADIEYAAYKCLCDESVRKAVADKYKFIFIDEYQDVNALQDSIFTLIDKNNSFMVGDLKQSIYGFRGCSSDFFAKKTKELILRDDANVVTLNKNWRSEKGILKYCDKLFYQIMCEEYGTPYSAFLDDSVVDDMVNCQLVCYQPPENEDADNLKIYSVKEIYENGYKSEDSITGCAVAKIILDNLGKEYIEHTKDENGNPIEKVHEYKYSDFAVLVRGDSVGSAVIDALLHAGIPVANESGADIRNYPEIKKLMSYLKLLACFDDDISLATSLKCMANLTENDLYDIRANGGKDDSFKQCYEKCLNIQFPLQERLQRFENYYRKMRLRAGVLPVGDLLESIIKDNNLDIRWRAMRLGDERMNRVNRFLVEAQQFNSPNLLAFISRIQDGGDILIAGVSGENCVTISTMHKSKGLEYPFVIVCGLEKEFNNRDFTREEVFYSRNYGFAIKSFDTDKKVINKNILRNYIAIEKNKELINEELRLFYVALTRAKNSLYLVCVKDELPEYINEDFFTIKSFSGFVTSNDHYSVANTNELSELFVNLEDNVLDLAGPGDDALKEKIKINLTNKYAFEDAIEIPQKTSVTQATTIELSDSETNYAVAFNYSDDDAVMRGNAYHKYLELYDFDRGVLTQELSKEYQEIIDVNRAKQIVDLPIFKSLMGWDCYREKKFICNVPSSLLYGKGEEAVLIQGAIDLLAIKGDKAKIIDYKYSLKGRDKLIERYQGQLKLYKYAVEKALNVTVEEMILVNLNSLEIININ